MLLLSILSHARAVLAALVDPGADAPSDGLTDAPQPLPLGIVDAPARPAPVADGPRPERAAGGAPAGRGAEPAARADGRGGTTSFIAWRAAAFAGMEAPREDVGAQWDALPAAAKAEWRARARAARAERAVRVATPQRRSLARSPIRSPSTAGAALAAAVCARGGADGPQAGQARRRTCPQWARRRRDAGRGRRARHALACVVRDRGACAASLPSALRRCSPRARRARARAAAVRLPDGQLPGNAPTGSGVIPPSFSMHLITIGGGRAGPAGPGRKFGFRCRRAAGLWVGGSRTPKFSTSSKTCARGSNSCRGAWRDTLKIFQPNSKSRRRYSQKRALAAQRPAPGVVRSTPRRRVGSMCIGTA